MTDSAASALIGHGNLNTHDAAPDRSVYCQKTQPRSRKGPSRGLPIVIVEHAAKFFLASDGTHLGQGQWWLDQFVVDPLMVASIPIVIDENRDGFSEMFFTEENQAA